MAYIATLIFSLLIIHSYSLNISNPDKNVFKNIVETNRIDNQTVAGTASCPDRDIAYIMNSAISSFIHDMDALSKSILNGIIAARKPGQWLVHAQVITGSRQGREWQTSTNSAIFTQKDQYACYYHDLQTYILVTRVY